MPRRTRRRAGRPGTPAVGAEPGDRAAGDGRRPGRLVIVGAPIGDPADASPRVLAALAGADVLAAEDTRRLRRLVGALGVTPTGRVVSYYDAVEAARTPELVAALLEGAEVALVADAGMPLVSDPGYRLVAAAAAAGVAVTAVPGPSAVTTALAVSGLPADRWCFEGFLPRRAGERRARLAELAGERRTVVLFEAPHRVAACLADLAAAWGEDRAAVVCRELTKTYEEVRRGPLGELAAWAADGVRGEVTLVVTGAPVQPAGEAPEPAGLAARVTALIAAGEPRGSAISAVAVQAGVPRRVVFDATVAAKSVRAPAAPTAPRAAGDPTID